MRAVQIALLVICIQVGLGLVATANIFGKLYYESELTNVNFPSGASAISESEQTQISINVMNTVFNALTWGWIKIFFEPYYSLDAQTKIFVDKVVFFLNSVSLFVIGIAFIEFIRNRVSVLGG